VLQRSPLKLQVPARSCKQARRELQAVSPRLQSKSFLLHRSSCGSIFSSMVGIHGGVAWMKGVKPWGHTRRRWCRQWAVMVLPAGRKNPGGVWWWCYQWCRCHGEEIEIGPWGWWWFSQRGRGWKKRKLGGGRRRGAHIHGCLFLPTHDICDCSRQGIRRLIPRGHPTLSFSLWLEVSSCIFMFRLDYFSNFLHI
jgi:hypothetical protein